MSDTSRVIRKFERMMGRTHEELMELRRNPPQSILSKKNSKKIGHFKYDFNKGTEKFVYSKI